MTTEQLKNVEKKKKSKKSKKSKTISFDEEVVTKDAAEKILANVKSEQKKKSKKNKKKKQNKTNNKEISEDVTEETQYECINESNASGMEVDEEVEPPKKKKRNQLKIECEQAEGSSENSKKDKKTESIRSIKRKRYAKLLEDKKQKTELQLQERSLNYLSKWKHSRNEWKFEKLRQIWLQTNMFDDSKVPAELWETLVQYFSNSKGKSRDTLLKEALKIIESQESSEESAEISDKAQRARDIIQNLQE